MRSDPLPPEQYAAAQLGLLYSELNTIFARIRRRRDGEPRNRERERIAELKTQITRLKSGEYLP